MFTSHSVFFTFPHLAQNISSHADKVVGASIHFNDATCTAICSVAIWSGIILLLKVHLVLLQHLVTLCAAHMFTLWISVSLSFSNNLIGCSNCSIRYYFLVWFLLNLHSFHVIKFINAHFGQFSLSYRIRFAIVFVYRSFFLYFESLWPISNELLLMILYHQVKV